MRLIRLLICSSLCVQPLHAAVLGDIQVRSALGEPLNARINVIANENEELANSCFRYISMQNGSSVHLNARLSFEPNENGGVLTLRGDEPVQEPLLSFSIRLRCPSEKSASFQRDYNVLLDPREYRAKQSNDVLPPLALTRRHLPAFSSAWQSQEGDSVQSIARAYFPQDSGNRSRMVDEIYRLNPGLAQNTHARLAFNTEVKLPDRKSVFNAAARIKDTVALDQVTNAETPAVKEILQITAQPLAVATQNGFHLRLSGLTLGVSKSVQLNPEESLRARERLQLLETDDQTAQLLQFKYQITQLEKQLAALQSTRPSAEPATEKTLGLASFNKDLLPSAWWLLLPVFIWLPIYFLRRPRRDEEQDAFPMGQSTFGDGTASTLFTESLREVIPSRSQVMGVVSNFSQAASDWSRDDVDVVQPKNASEEAQMLLDHGLMTQAINLLHSEIEQYPSALVLWMKLFDIYVGQGMRQEFQNRAVGFRLQFSSDSLWQQVQVMGRIVDEDNPLYLSLDESLDESLMFPQAAVMLTKADRSVEHIDFATGEVLEVKDEAWHLESNSIELTLPIELPASAAGSVQVNGVKLDLAAFLTDDPQLKQVVDHLEESNIHAACQELEQLLYRGTMEQRQKAIKWLDILIPLQM
jgi:pilus assembly protein FimV